MAVVLGSIAAISGLLGFKAGKVALKATAATITVVPIVASNVVTKGLVPLGKAAKAVVLPPDADAEKAKAMAGTRPLARAVLAGPRKVVALLTVHKAFFARKQVLALAPAVTVTTIGVTALLGRTKIVCRIGRALGLVTQAGVGVALIAAGPALVDDAIVSLLPNGYQLLAFAEAGAGLACVGAGALLVVAALPRKAQAQAPVHKGHSSIEDVNVLYAEPPQQRTAGVLVHTSLARMGMNAILGLVGVLFGRDARKYHVDGDKLMMRGAVLGAAAMGSPMVGTAAELVLGQPLKPFTHTGEALYYVGYGVGSCVLKRLANVIWLADAAVRAVTKGLTALHRTWDRVEACVVEYTSLTYHHTMKVMRKSALATSMWLYRKVAVPLYNTWEPFCDYFCRVWYSTTESMTRAFYRYLVNPALDVVDVITANFVRLGRGLRSLGWFLLGRLQPFWNLACAIGDVCQTLGAAVWNWCISEGIFSKPYYATIWLFCRTVLPLYKYLVIPILERASRSFIWPIVTWCTAQGMLSHALGLPIPEARMFYGAFIAVTISGCLVVGRNLCSYRNVAGVGEPLSHFGDMLQVGAAKTYMLLDLGILKLLFAGVRASTPTIKRLFVEPLKTLLGVARAAGELLDTGIPTALDFVITGFGTGVKVAVRKTGQGMRATATWLRDHAIVVLIVGAGSTGAVCLLQPVAPAIGASLAATARSTSAKCAAVARRAALRTAKATSYAARTAWVTFLYMPGVSPALKFSMKLNNGVKGFVNDNLVSVKDEGFATVFFMAHVVQAATTRAVIAVRKRRNQVHQRSDMFLISFVSRGTTKAIMGPMILYNACRGLEGRQKLVVRGGLLVMWSSYMAFALAEALYYMLQPITVQVTQYSLADTPRTRLIEAHVINRKPPPIIKFSGYCACCKESLPPPRVTGSSIVVISRSLTSSMAGLISVINSVGHTVGTPLGSLTRRFYSDDRQLEAALDDAGQGGEAEEEDAEAHGEQKSSRTSRVSFAAPRPLRTSRETAGDPTSTEPSPVQRPLLSRAAKVQRSPNMTETSGERALSFENKQRDMSKMKEVLPPVILRCGHCFHRPCIMDWLEDSSRCPVCKELCVGSKTRRVAANLFF